MNKYPWARGLNIPKETISMWEMQAGSSDLLRWALANNKINEFKYQEWAKVYYQLPTLDTMFFDQSPNPELWTRWGSYSWSGSFLPIYEWEGILYIACLEPPNEKQAELIASLETKVGFLIAPISGMKKWWSILQPAVQYQNTNTHLPPELAAFSSGGTPDKNQNLQQTQVGGVPVSSAANPSSQSQFNNSNPYGQQNQANNFSSQIPSNGPNYGNVNPSAASMNNYNQSINSQLQHPVNQEPVQQFNQQVAETAQVPMESVSQQSPQSSAAEVYRPQTKQAKQTQLEQDTIEPRSNKGFADSLASEVKPIPTVVELPEEMSEFELESNISPEIELRKLEVNDPTINVPPPIDAIANTNSVESAPMDANISVAPAIAPQAARVPVEEKLPMEEDLSLDLENEPSTATGFVQEMPTAPSIPKQEINIDEPELAIEETVMKPLEELTENPVSEEFNPDSLLGDSAQFDEGVAVADSIEGLEGISLDQDSGPAIEGLDSVSLEESSDSAKEASMDSLEIDSSEQGPEEMEGLDFSAMLKADEALSFDLPGDLSENPVIDGGIAKPPSAHLVPDEEDVVPNISGMEVASTNVTPLKVAHPKLVNTKDNSNSKGEKSPQNKEEEMAYRAIDQFGEYFEKVMILNVDQMLAKPVYWEGQWVENKNVNANIDLSMGSVFRIVFTSRKSYHGYVVRNSINDGFFNAFNKGQLPEHATLVPVNLEGNLVAIIVGFTSAQNGETISLEDCERIAENYAKDIKEFYKKQASAA